LRNSLSRFHADRILFVEDSVDLSEEHLQFHALLLNFSLEMAGRFRVEMIRRLPAQKMINLAFNPVKRLLETTLSLLRTDPLGLQICET